MRQLSPRAKTLVFWSILVVLHLGYLGFQLSQKNLFLQDSKEYVQEAENIASRGMFYCGDPEAPIRTDYFTKRPPLYPVLLMILPGTYPVLFFQVMLSLFNIWLVLQIISLLGIPSKRMWWLLPFIFFFPAQMIYPTWIMSEIVLQSLILGMVMCLLKWWKSDKFSWLWIYNGLLILAFLVKPVMYPFVIVNFVVLGFGIWRKKASPFLLTTAVVPLVTLVLYCGWNYQRTGAFHFSSIQQINLLQYNAYYTLLRAEGEAIANQTVDDIAHRANSIATYPDRLKFISTQSTDILLQHKWAYTQLHLKGIVNFFLDPGRFDLYSFWGIEKRDGKGKGLLHAYSTNGYTGIFDYLKQQPTAILLILGLVLLFNLLKVAAIGGFAYQKKILLFPKLIILGFIFYVAFLTGPLGASRFALPVFPLLLVVVAGSRIDRGQR